MGQRFVCPAIDAANQQRWIAFPRQSVYASSSPWVSPLDADMRRLLNRRLNPFFRVGDALPLLAVDASDRVLGRLLVHHYPPYNERHHERTAFFGFFECLDDLAAAQALFGAAAAYAIEHGCDKLLGPFNMTPSQEMGILTDGFDEPPAVDMVYTAPYYPKLLQGSGLRPVFPMRTLCVDDIACIDPDTLLGARERRLLASGRLRLRALDASRLDAEIELIRELAAEAFSRHRYFVAPTAAEFQFQIAPFRRLLDLNLALIAELDGAPCGFVVLTPDFNPLLKRMQGASGPLATLLFACGRSQVRDAVGTYLGVQRRAIGRGVAQVLEAEVIRALQRGGYRRLILTWIADDNRASMAVMERLQPRSLHRLTLFEGQIPLSLPVLDTGKDELSTRC